MLQATKSVVQPYRSEAVDGLLGECLTLTYNAMCYGEGHNVTNRKKMKEFYRSLKEVELPSCYKRAVITRACAILKSRMKSENRGVETKHSRRLRPMVCITSGFFVTAKGRLFIPLKRDVYVDVLRTTTPGR